MFGATESTSNAAFEALFMDPDDDTELRRMLYPDNDEEMIVFDDDDEEFLGALPGVLGAVAGIPGAVVNTVAQQGARAINTLLQPPRKATVNVKPPTNWGTQIPGSTSATVMTPGGPVPIKFQKAFVTKTQLDAALEGVRRDIGAVRTALQATDARHNKALDNVSKTTATAIAADAAKTRQDIVSLERRLNRKLDDQRQFSLLMTLMGGDAAGDDMLIPLMMMMNSGENGGGGFDSNMMMMLFAMRGL